MEDDVCYRCDTETESDYLIVPPPPSDMHMRIHSTAAMADAATMAVASNGDTTTMADYYDARHAAESDESKVLPVSATDEASDRVDVHVRGETIMYMSPAEMRSMRTLNYHYTATAVDARNGLNDARGGANLYADTCETCSLDAEHCKGTHFGTIEHAQPHVLQTDAGAIERTLATVCTSCSQPAIATCSYRSELDVMYGIPSDTQAYFFSREAHARMQFAFDVKPIYFEESEPAYPRRLPLWVASDRDTLELKLTLLHMQQTQIAKKLASAEMEHLILHPRRFESDWIEKHRHWLSFLEDPHPNHDFLSAHGVVLSESVIQMLLSRDSVAANNNNNNNGSGGVGAATAGAADMSIAHQLLTMQKTLFLYHEQLARLDGFLILLPVNVLQRTRKLRDEFELATLTLEGHRSALATFHANVDAQAAKKCARMQSDVQRLEAFLPGIRARLDAAHLVETELRREIDRRRYIYARTLDYFRNRGKLHTVFRAEITRRLIAYYTVSGGDTRNAETAHVACTFKTVNTKFNAPYKLPLDSLKIGSTRELVNQSKTIEANDLGRITTRKQIRVVNRDTGVVQMTSKETKAAIKPAKVNKRKRKEQQEYDSALAILESEGEMPVVSSSQTPHVEMDPVDESKESTEPVFDEVESGVVDDNHDVPVSMIDEEDEMKHESSSSSSQGEFARERPPSPGHAYSPSTNSSETMTEEERTLFAREFARIGISDGIEQRDADGDGGGGGVDGAIEDDAANDDDDDQDAAASGEKPMRRLPHATSLQGFLCHLPYQRIIPQSEYTLYWFSGTYSMRQLVKLNKHSYHKYYAGVWEGEKRFRLRNEYDLDHALLGHVYRKRLEAEFRKGVDEFIQYQRTIVSLSSKETKRFHAVPHSDFVGIPHYSGHSSSKNNLSILRCCMGAGGCGADVFHVRTVAPQNAFQFIAEHPSQYTNNRFLMDHVVRHQSFEFFAHRILSVLKHIPPDHIHRLGYRATRPDWLVRVATIVPAHRLRPQTENAEFKHFWTRQAAKILAHEEDISVMTARYIALTGLPYFYGVIHEERFERPPSLFIVRTKWVNVEACACVGDISVTLVHATRWVDPKKTTQHVDFKKMVLFVAHAAAATAAGIRSRGGAGGGGGGAGGGVGNREVSFSSTGLVQDTIVPFQFMLRTKYTSAFEYRLPKAGKMGRSNAAKTSVVAAASFAVSSSASSSSSSAGATSDNQRAFLRDECFFGAGIEPLTSAEEKYLVKHTEKIFSHTLMLKPHINGENANVANFIDGKFGFVQRHYHAKRTKNTSRKVLLSAPYASPMAVVVSSKFMRHQVSHHEIHTATQCAFWKHRARVSFLSSMRVAHRKARCLERMATLGAPLSQLDYQRYPDLVVGNVYPRIHTIADIERKHEKRDFMTPERILSKSKLVEGGSAPPTPGVASTTRVDGITPSEWEAMETMLAACEAQGGNEEDFWNALAYATAPEEQNSSGAGSLRGGRPPAPLYATSVRHMQALLTPAMRAKMEREANLITTGTVIDYSLVPGDVEVTGRNPTLHRYNLTCAVLHKGNVGYGVGQNGCKYPAENADNDGDAVHDVIPQNEAARVEAKNIMSPAYACLNVQNGSNVDGLVGDALLSLFVISKSRSMYVSEAMFLNFVRRIQLIRLDSLHAPRPEQPPLDPSQIEGAEGEGASAPSNSTTMDGTDGDDDGDASMAREWFDDDRPPRAAPSSSSSSSSSKPFKHDPNHKPNYEYALHEIHEAARWKHLDTSPVAVHMHATHESFCRAPTRYHAYSCPQPNLPRKRADEDAVVAVPPPRKPHIRAYHLQQLVDVCLPRDFCFVGGSELHIENGCVSPSANMCSKKFFGISDVSVWKSLHIRYDPAYVMEIKFELQSVMFDVMRFFQFAHSPTQLQLPIPVRERMNRRIDQFRRQEAKAAAALNSEFKQSFDAVVNATYRSPTLHDLHFAQSLKRSYTARVELMLNEQTALRSSYIDATIKTWMTQFVDHFFASHPFYFVDLLTQPETIAFLQRPDASQIDPEVCQCIRGGGGGAGAPHAPGTDRQNAQNASGAYGAPAPSLEQVVTDQFQVPLMFLYILSGVKGKVTDWANIAYSLGMQTLDDQLIRRTIEGRIQSSSEFGDLSLERNGFIQVGLTTGMLVRDFMVHAQNSRAKNAASSLLISQPGEMNNTLASTMGSLRALEDNSVMNENGHMVQATCGRGLLNAEVLYKMPFPVDEWVQTLDRTKHPRFIHHVTQAVRTWLGLLTPEELRRKTDADTEAEHAAIELMRSRWGGEGSAPSNSPLVDVLRQREDWSTASDDAALYLLCARAADRWANRTMVSEIRTFKTPFNMPELVCIAKQKHVDTHYVAPLPEDVFDIDGTPETDGSSSSNNGRVWGATIPTAGDIIAQVDSLVQFMHHSIRHIEAAGENAHQYPFVDQETFVREHLCVVQVREHYKLTHQQLCMLIRRMKRRFVDALVEPGTAVGPQAQHATAEPLTQLMLRVFHFVDKLQQHGGVSYLRALLQLSVKIGGFFVEVALRDAASSSSSPAACAPFYTPITESMSDAQLDSMFAQHSIMDLVHDISNVVSRCYVPRNASVARILSEQRAMDVDQYGSIVQYVVMPTALSRHNMPNEYQAFYELQRDYHIPDEACRVVLSLKRFQRAQTEMLPFIARFCSELLNVFRVEIWRHQHAIDPHVLPPGRLQADPAGDTTYVLYIRHLAPIRTPTLKVPDAKIQPNFEQHPMQIYSANEGPEGPRGPSHSPQVGVVAVDALVVAETVQAAAAAAMLVPHGPRSMEQAFSVDGQQQQQQQQQQHAVAVAADQIMALYEGPAASSSASSSTSSSSSSSSSSSADLGGASRRGLSQSSLSARGRGRPKNATAAVRKPRKPATVKPVKEKIVKNPKRAKVTRPSLEPIIEEDDDDGPAVAHVPMPIISELTVDYIAPHAVGTAGSSAAALPATIDPAVLPITLPTMAPQTTLSVSAVALAVAAAPLPPPPPVYPPPIFPFNPARLLQCPDILTSTPLGDCMGISMHRTHSDVFNTPLFVQDHVFRTLCNVLPHTSISSIQLIRKKPAGSKDATSPFSELDRTTVRFRVNASITSVKLLAFLARPEFDPRFIHIRDPITMHRFWGITAFSNSIVDEITRTLQAAVDIDLGVPNLIAAWMSHLGYPMKMSPSGAADSGQNHTQRSLVRSSYKIMIQAAQRGENASFNSVLSTVAVGNRIPLGTGTVDILRSKDSSAVTHREQLQRKKDAREHAERTNAFRFLVGAGT